MFLVTGTLATAQIAPIDKNGVAIRGYDVVAYFLGEVAQGFEGFSEKYNGNTYYFSTKKNEFFKKSPKQYLPQYEGYCAWAVATKKAKFPINPETFHVVDGKLYLFYNAPFKGELFDTSIPWRTEATKLINESKKNWPTVKKS